MADIAGTPLESFAAGFFSGRVDSEFRESAQATYYQLVSVDSGPAGLGATITAGQNSQALGYQIQASLTWFTTVTPGVTGNGNTPTAFAVLPQTSRPYPFTGLQVVVANYGANPINCTAHPNDAGNSINGLGLNVPVILGPNTITPFQCLVPGGWNAVDIGGGFNGSIETVVSQGLVQAAGSTQATATQITQGMANVASSAASQGVALPRALAGSQITINPTGLAGNTPLLVYPINGGTDAINALGANTAFSITLPVTSPTIFFCFVTGTWQTK